MRTMQSQIADQPSFTSRRRAEAGVTLIETLIVVAISGLIMVPLLGWGLTAMKTQAIMRDSNLDSASVGLLRTYFIRDVASADSAKTAAAAEGTDCTGGAGAAQSDAETVLRLATGATTYVTYNVTTDSDGTGTSIWRRECDDATLVATAEMVRRVDEASTSVTCSPRTGAPSSDCGRIHMDTATTDGGAVSMTATIRTGDAVSAPADPVYESPLVNIAVTHPDPLYRGQDVTFDATATTDPRGQALTHFWDLGDGTTSTDASTTHAYSALGEFTAIYTATNEDGTPASDYKRVEVLNRPPTAVISAPSGSVNTHRCTNVSFAATGSNDSGDAAYGGSVSSYNWDYGDGTTSTRSSAAAHNHQFAKLSGSGPLTVSLSVTDNEGGVSATETRSATVTNRPPNAFTMQANGSGSDISVNGVTTVNFTSNASDPDLCGTSDEALEYNWDFGDGGTSTDANPSHTFTSGGSHEVTLEVTDGSGESVTSTNSISVTINQIPVAAFTLDDYDFRAGTNLTNWVNNDSYDPDGGALTYVWTFQNATSPTGGTSTAFEPTPVNFTHNIVGSGDTFIGATYTVTLEVKDPLGATANASRTVTVSGAPAPTGLNKSGEWRVCVDQRWWGCADYHYFNSFGWNASAAPIDQYQLEIKYDDCWIGTCWTYTYHNTPGTSITIEEHESGGGTAYIRVRARDTNTGKWGPWSPERGVNLYG